MKDLFEREQKIYDEAFVGLDECQVKDTVVLEKYHALVDEYGKLLRQLRRMTRVNDAVAGELKAGQQDLLGKVYYDELTGVYSRRFMKENIDEIFESSVYYGEPLSLVMVDIDFFKNYNDTYGHQQGDECLRLIATSIKDSVKRREDFVARYGGEEFLVVLPNTDEQGAETAVQRIISNIRECQIEHSDSKVASFVTVSMGVFTCTIDENSKSEDWIEKADKALYTSKLSGRDQYNFFNDGETKE